MARTISSGTTYSDATLANEDLAVESGAIIARIKADQNGKIYLFGEADSVTINNGGQMSVYGGASALETTVNKGGYLIAGNGGIVKNTKINDGVAYVLAAGSAYDTVIGASGVVNVQLSGLADRTTVNVGGALVISSGATATRIVENGGAVYVSAGANVAFAKHTIENLILSRGSATLHSGTTAANAIITRDGNVNVHQGGLFLSGVVSSNTAAGGLCLTSGALASALTVEAGGIVYVMAGGSVAGLTVNAGGSLSILSGATVTGLKDNGGNVYIADGTSVTYAANIISGMVLSSGAYSVRSGTTLTKAVVTKDGNMSVNEGGLFLSGSVSSTTSLGGLCLNYGGVASATGIGRGGVMYVMSGGSAVTCSLAGGTLSMNQGAVANGLIMTSGSLTVQAGAVMTNAIVKGGTVYYLTGAKANATTLSTSGQLTVCSGAIASGLTVSSGGTLTVQSGAKVYDLKDNGGYVYIQEGATVTFAPNVIDGFILSSGYYYVHSGTTLTNAIVAGEGMIIVSSGGVVDAATVSRCNTTQYKGLYVSSGGTAYNTKVASGGALYVYDYGSAVGGTVSSGGFIQVRENASAQGLLVQPGGSLTILSGATVTDLKDNGGSVYIVDGATVTFASNVIDKMLVSSGTYNVFSGTTLTNPTVVANGVVNVYEGGVVQSAIVNSCNASQYKGLYISSGGTAINTLVKSGGAFYLYSRGSAVGGTISSGGRCQIGGSAFAQDIVVMPGASLTVLTGATVTGLKDSGGYVYIESGANVSFAPNVIDKLIASSGTYNIFSGTTLTNAVVAANGLVNVLQGGVVRSATVNSCNATQYKGLYISSGGLAIDTQVNSGGVLYLMAGGTASGVDVAAGGACQMRANASATNVTVRSGANLTVSSGATAYNILEDGGTVTVLNGATVTFVERVVSDTIITKGTTTIHDGTTLVNTVIGGTGKLNVNAGGKTVSTTVNSCSSEGGLVISSGGVAYDNVMNDLGFTYIFSGGTAIDNTIHSGGSMTIFGGAIMSNVEIESGGLLYLSSGAVLTGRIRVATLGAYIFIDDHGTTIDFDISKLDPSGDHEVLLDDMERIRPEPKEAPYKPNYTITVAPDQSIGTYQIALARQRVDFPTITVKSTDGSTLGTLSENGTFRYNGLEYRLSYTLVINTALQQGVVTLFLHIGDDTNDKGPAMPVVSANVVEPTKNAVTVTASFDTAASKRLYSFDASTWMDYNGGVTVTQNCRVYFRAENKSGASGISSYTVRNIDTVAPTAPAGLVATVADHEVTLSWRPAADDSSGVKDYYVTYSHDGQVFKATVAETSYVIKDAAAAKWQWSVQAVDKAGNLSSVSNGESFVVAGGDQPPAPTYAAKSDIDGNGVSDVMFVWTGEHGEGNYQHGYWMNGTSEWRSANASHPAEWVNLGCHDMSGDGKADSVLVGNVEVGGVKGAYIGYYSDAHDLADGSTWVNIGFLNNPDDIDWKNAVGKLNGNETDANSIVWHSAELGALGAWVGGTDAWVSLGGGFDSNWKLIGCGDFYGEGADSVVMCYNSGEKYYVVNYDGVASELANSDNGWEVRAIGDFSGDGRDDIVAFHAETGLVAKWSDGNSSKWSQLGQLDAKDWFVVGCGDYNGDQNDDLLVRQYSTGMLGYYSNGDMSQWNVLGYGVDMSWTVIA